MNAVKLTWSTAHTALTEDMRELLARFNEATPLQLTVQLSELRQGLALEAKHRGDAVEGLSQKLQDVDALLKGSALKATISQHAPSEDSARASLTRKLNGLAASGDNNASMLQRTSVTDKLLVPDTVPGGLKGRTPMLSPRSPMSFSARSIRK